MYRIKAFLTILTFMLLTACGSGDLLDAAAGSGTGSGSGSGSGSGTLTGSHNPGQECIACHQEGGIAAAAGIYTVAGTVYKSGGGVQPNATVKLYTRNTNTLVASLVTDDSGNFFTKAFVKGLSYGGSLASGTDVVVTGPGGDRRMSGIVTAGACGICHGKTNGKIVAN